MKRSIRLQTRYRRAGNRKSSAPIYIRVPFYPNAEDQALYDAIFLAAAQRRWSAGQLLAELAFSAVKQWGILPPEAYGWEYGKRKPETGTAGEEVESEQGVKPEAAGPPRP